MKPIFYILLLSISISCNQNQVKESTELNKAQITTEIEQFFSDYHTAISERGLTAEFEYLDHSSDFFWVPPAYETALNYDSVRTILEQNAKAFQSITFEWDTLQIFPLSDEIASYSGIVHGRMIDTADVESLTAIIESGTLIKRSDGWKLLNGQSAMLEPNSLLPK